MVDVTDDSIAAASAAVEHDVESGPAEPAAWDGNLEDAEDEPHEDTIELFLDEPDDDEPDDDEPDDDEPDDDEPAVDAAVTAAPVAASDNGPDAEPTQDPESSPEQEQGDAAEPVDPDELRVLPVVPVVAAVTPAPTGSSDAGGNPAASDNDDADDDDTGEVPIIGAGSFGPGDPSGDDASVYEFSDFSDDQYLQNATREHQDLAAAIDAADSEDTHQVAVSAAIPGLESGVVGFDDVVAAGEGDAAVPAPPRQPSYRPGRRGLAI